MTPRAYRFDGFLLHAATRELRHDDGRQTVLPARIFDCVLHLIEHRDRAVGRDELVAVIWNRAEVGDNVLAQLMARTRKILDDAGTEQRVIRTIPGFGYWWIAPTITSERGGQPVSIAVAPSGPQDPSLSAGTEDVPAATPRNAHDAQRKSRWPFARRSLVVVLLATLVGAALQHQDGSRATFLKSIPWVGTSAPVRSSPSARSVVVLPATVDPSAGEDWVRLGVMALVNERLASAGLPTVPSDNVVALTRGLDIPTLNAESYSTIEIAAAASWLLQPHVEHVDDQWRVTLAVVHGDAPIKLSVTSENAQILDAARDAADRLMAGMGAGPSTAAPVSNVDLALVLQRAQADFLDGKLDQARQLLLGARGRFPGSAELDFQLAMLDFSAGDLDLAQQRLESMVANAAVENDPLMAARALNTLASVRYQRRDFNDVERYSRQAIDLLQADTKGTRELGRAWGEQARAAGAQGHYDVSLADAGKARVLLAAAGDWMGVARIDLQTGIVLNASGRLRESLPLFERAAERFGQFHAAWNEGVARTQLAVALLNMANPAAALAQEVRLGELDAHIDYPSMRAALQANRANVLVANGRLAEAHALIDGFLPSVVEKHDRLNLYFVHAVAARHAYASERWAAAETESKDALASLFDPEEDARDVARTYLLLARLQSTHDLAAAVRTRAALDARVGAENRGNGRLYVDLIDATIAKMQGSATSTRAAYEAALKLSAAAPIDLLGTAQDYVPWLLAHGEPERAAEVLGLLTDLSYRHFDAAVLELRFYEATHQKAASQIAVDRAHALAGERVVRTDLRSSMSPPSAVRY